MPKDKGIQLNDHNDPATGGEIMDLKIDPVRGADGKIMNGLVVGKTLKQNQALLLLAQPGDLKFAPTLGVGIEDALLSDDFLVFRHLIREHFAVDGMRVNRLDFYPGKPFKVEAVYQ